MEWISKTEFQRKYKINHQAFHRLINNGTVKWIKAGSHYRVLDPTASYALRYILHQDTIDSAPFVRASEVAAAVGVRAATLSSWRRQGYLQGGHDPHGKPIYSVLDIWKALKIRYRGRLSIHGVRPGIPEFVIKRLKKITDKEIDIATMGRGPLPVGVRRGFKPYMPDKPPALPRGF